MRLFNQKAVELLAPAGTFVIFEKIIDTNCDAVYFGGKRFNMRLHRKDFNFSNDELGEAVRIAHGKNKRAYITVNNLYNEDELPQLREYLLFLAGIKPDAILVQDFSVIRLVHELRLSLSLHASVMMNVHNLAFIKRLAEWGVKRIVLSRELPLSYAREIAVRTSIEAEYFVHGDMCVTHGGQCLYSGILFGQSSNQGRCLKPCRWEYSIERGGKRYETGFPLAVKDMYLYEHIPELIFNGITCFKIEGRMRDCAYLTGIVNSYGDAIDRYIADPLSYNRKKDSADLAENRKRDFSTAYAFGKPGLANINKRLEGTGAFYSTGKVFSVATQEPELTADVEGWIRESLNRPSDKPAAATGGIELSCTAHTVSQARACINRGVNHIYLASDTFLPAKPFSIKDILELAERKGKSKLYFGQSRMVFDQDRDEYQQFLQNIMAQNPTALDGILVTNLGGIRGWELPQNLPLVGDYGLNIHNSEAWAFYKSEGLERFTVSPELKLPHAVRLFAQAGEDAELIVFGSPTVMYMEHDLFANTETENSGTETAASDMLYLVDGKGFRHPVYRDRNNRNHMILCKDLWFVPFLKELCRAGVRRFRMEAAYLPQDSFERALDALVKAVTNLDEAQTAAAAFTPPRSGFTAGAWHCADAAQQEANNDGR